MRERSFAISLNEKREASESQARAMDVDELHAPLGEDEYGGYWSFEAEAESKYHAEHRLNIVCPYNGYGNGHGHKGKAHSEGNSHVKGWQNNQGWLQGSGKGWQMSDGRASEGKGWAGQDAMGRGKSKGKGFRGTVMYAEKLGALRADARTALFGPCRIQESTRARVRATSHCPDSRLGTSRSRPTTSSSCPTASSEVWSETRIGMQTFGGCVP